jgi:hypothetical protein
MAKGIQLTDLPEDWKEQMHELARNGRSMPTFIKQVGLTVRKHATLKANYPEYDEAVEHAKVLNKAWWLEWGQDNLMTKGVNQGIFSMYMKNQHGWRDSPVSKETGDTILKDVERDAELEAKFKKSPEKEQLVQ